MHSGVETAKNCEMPKQLDLALRVLQSGSQNYSTFNRKVESMSMAIHLLQEMITNERELEVEHWLV